MRLRLRDLGKSLFHKLSKDASDSPYEYFTILGRIAWSSFVRMARGVPAGFFEEAGLRFPKRMQDIFHGFGRPIVIIPVGDISSDVIEAVARTSYEIYGLPVRVIRTRVIWPEVYNPRDQTARADQILKVITPFTRYGRVIVVTDIKLVAEMNKKEFPEELYISHVYGFGNVQIPISVVSTYSFGFGGNDDHLPLARLIKTTIHELAHTFGVNHHAEDNISCVMNMAPDADGRRGLDIMSPELCARCIRIITTGCNEEPAQNPEGCFVA
jgi:predicted Zn-dependent protease